MGTKRNSPNCNQGAMYTNYEALNFLHILPVRKVLQDKSKGFHLLRLGFWCWYNTPAIVHEMVHKSREPEKPKQIKSQKQDSEL